MADALSHADLVQLAKRWLERTRGCVVVVTEPRPYASVQSPDVIGWCTNGWSVMVECKTSRSDFVADKRKLYARAGYECVGQERWYYAPKGIIRPDDLPEGWGLLEPTRDGKARRAVQADASEWHPERFRAEAPFFVQIARMAVHGPEELRQSRRELARANSKANSAQRVLREERYEKRKLLRMLTPEQRAEHSRAMGEMDSGALV